MSIRRRLQALERQVRQPSYRLTITLVDETGQRWRFNDDGVLVPAPAEDLAGVRVIRLDLEDDES
jgi:hypothetical protein